MNTAPSSARVAKPTDLIPKCFVSDPTYCLLWWLRNPLLVYHYPNRMAATEALVPGMSLDERRKKIWALRGARNKARATKPSPPEPSDETPNGLPRMPWAQFAELLDEIEDKAERDDVRAFARRHTEYELPWLAEQLRFALQARTQELATSPEYQH
ncbi:hypothetical protein GCM10023185_29980 [Hymenobacter saemangeumensis]|uniref:Uncharacterized protein n=1 Tax=Hymenobacter saemangeumensis TaxID=1084522 RepID=A0ABP8ILA1_9BACT